MNKTSSEHPCPHCLTKFQSPSHRDRHARAVHEKWRDYKYPHCSSLFAHKGNMVKHCRTVSYSCNAYAPP